MYIAYSKHIYIPYMEYYMEPPQEKYCAVTWLELGNQGSEGWEVFIMIWGLADSHLVRIFNFSWLLYFPQLKYFKRGEVWVMGMEVFINWGLVASHFRRLRSLSQKGFVRRKHQNCFLLCANNTVCICLPQKKSWYFTPQKNGFGFLKVAAVGGSQLVGAYF